MLDPQATPLMAIRNAKKMPALSLNDLAETAFGRMILGDDQAVHAVYIAGSLTHKIESQDYLTRDH
jgi:guanine deaminase